MATTPTLSVAATEHAGSGEPTPLRMYAHATVPTIWCDAASSVLGNDAAAGQVIGERIGGGPAPWDRAAHSRLQDLRSD